jgi:hypothetical protein
VATSSGTTISTGATSSSQVGRSYGCQPETISATIVAASRPASQGV